jgi:hypothetical protein
MQDEAASIVQVARYLYPGRPTEILAGSKPFYWTLMAQLKIPLLLVLHLRTSFRSLIL